MNIILHCNHNVGVGAPVWHNATHFYENSSCNSSCLKKCSCELTLKQYSFFKNHNMCDFEFTVYFEIVLRVNSQAKCKGRDFRIDGLVSVVVETIIFCTCVCAFLMFRLVRRIKCAKTCFVFVYKYISANTVMHPSQVPSLRISEIFSI